MLFLFSPEQLTSISIKTLNIYIYCTDLVSWNRLNRGKISDTRAAKLNHFFPDVVIYLFFFVCLS